jgi:hypothetical protein
MNNENRRDYDYDKKNMYLVISNMYLVMLIVNWLLDRKVEFVG